jgi:hypothetical protein
MFLNLFIFQMYANQKIKIKNYSSRIPQWKKIDQEIKQLTQQYQKVKLWGNGISSDFRPRLNVIHNIGFQSKNLQRLSVPAKMYVIIRMKGRISIDK